MLKTIKEISKDYLKDFKKYQKKIKKKWQKFQKNTKEIIRKFNADIKEKDQRKKYLIGLASIIILTILIVNIYSSYAYYRDLDTFPFIHALVGNIDNKNYDYILKIYLENAQEKGKYHLVSDIPPLGYTFSGYKCQNNSILNYDNSLNAFTAVLNGQDNCSVYYNLISDTDALVNIMLEEEVNSDTYTLGEEIPAYGYVYSHYECDNNNTISYDSALHKVTMDTNKKDSCRIYFAKDNSDVTARIFLETKVNSGKYLEKMSIPSNMNYTLNLDKSSCKNMNNERIEANLTYIDGYLNANISEIALCEFYLDYNE